MLGDEHAIERVAMVPGQVLDVLGVQRGHRHRIEPQPSQVSVHPSSITSFPSERLIAISQTLTALTETALRSSASSSAAVVRHRAAITQ